MKDTILFDLDGTLVESLYDLADSVNYTLEYFGYNKRSYDEVRRFVGNGAEMLIKRALPENGIKDFEKAFAMYKKHYNTNLCNKTKPYNGIYELLSKLDEKGYKTGIVTNKPDNAAKIIADKILGGKIKAVVGAEPLKRRKKPEIDSVCYCLELLGSDRERTIYVGDSEVDVATAKNAGLLCIGVSWGFRGKESLVLRL